MNMHTLLPLLLKLGITLVLALLSLFGAVAQEVPAGSKKVHIKMIRDVNGKTELLDTTLVLTNEDDLLDAVRGIKGDTAMLRALKNSRVQAGRLRMAMPAKGLVADTARLRALKEASVRVYTLDSTLRATDRKALLERVRVLEHDSAVVKIMRHRAGSDSLGKHRIHRIEVLRKGDSLALSRLDSGERHIAIASPGSVTTIILFKTEIKEITAQDKQALKAAGAPVETSPKEELRLEEITYYPNPNNGRFNLSFTLSQKGTALVRVLDSSGKEIFKEQVKKQEGEYSREIDISKHGQGIYFVQVAQGKKYLTRKIVVQ